MGRLHRQSNHLFRVFFVCACVCLSGRPFPCFRCRLKQFLCCVAKVSPTLPNSPQTCFFRNEKTSGVDAQSAKKKQRKKTSVVSRLCFYWMWPDGNAEYLTNQKCSATVGKKKKWKIWLPGKRRNALKSQLNFLQGNFKKSIFQSYCCEIFVCLFFFFLEKWENWPTSAARQKRFIFLMWFLKFKWFRYQHIITRVMCSGEPLHIELAPSLSAHK